jgi:hypothetical protein
MNPVFFMLEQPSSLAEEFSVKIKNAITNVEDLYGPIQKIIQK